MKYNVYAALVLIGSLLVAGAAFAAETQPGDTCTAGQSGWFRVTGGPEQTPPQQVRCNGSTWVQVSAGGTAGLSETISINDLKDGISSNASQTVFLGYNAGLNNTSQANVGVGQFVMAGNVTGDGNTGVGARALINLTSGAFNVGLGIDSLAATTSGGGNIGVGLQAITANTTGFGNIGIGQQALNQQTVAVENIGIGIYSGFSNLGSRNTAIGSYSMSGTTGTIVTDTVALGYRAGVALTQSQQNTLLGAYAGQALTTGSKNLLLGYNTTTPSATTNNYINIASTIYGDSSSKIIGIAGAPNPLAPLAVSGDIIVSASLAGTSGCSSGNAGAIRYTNNALYYCNGTAFTSFSSGVSVTAAGVSGSIQFNSGGMLAGRASPAIDPSGHIYTSGTNIYSGNSASGRGYVGLQEGDGPNTGLVQFYLPGASSLGYIGYGTAAGGLNIVTNRSSPIVFYASNTEAVRIQPSGNVGIGKSNPGVALDVSGDIQYTGSLVDISDRRLKTEIKPWQSSALEKIALMKPITFEMKNRRGVIEYGFIAQEVQPIFPELVHTADDVSKTLSMNYVGMVAPMVKAIQELKAENEMLRRRLEKVEARQR